jgi:aerobic-type carbon monoxide dehydrogenase small subunit (CoxS/CutS family)
MNAWQTTNSKVQTEAVIREERPHRPLVFMCSFCNPGKVILSSPFFFKKKKKNNNNGIWTNKVMLYRIAVTDQMIRKGMHL